MSLLEPYQPLDLSKAVVLITGGSSGMGLALAKRFRQAGSTVIVTGRRERVLKEAQQHIPELKTYVSDAGSVTDRERLAQEIVQDHPHFNILVNNAGICRNVPLAEETSAWAVRQAELDINCSGPVHLAALFTPHLLKQPEACILNISSGLAFSPSTYAPTYGASKAFLHSWTMAARPHYLQSNVRIVELVPPALKTNLGGAPPLGEDVDDFLAETFPKFQRGDKEIGYGSGEARRLMSRQELDQYFENLSNGWLERGGRAKVFRA